MLAPRLTPLVPGACRLATLEARMLAAVWCWMCTPPRDPLEDARGAMRIRAPCAAPRADTRIGGRRRALREPPCRAPVTRSPPPEDPLLPDGVLLPARWGSRIVGRLMPVTVRRMRSPVDIRALPWRGAGRVVDDWPPLAALCARSTVEGWVVVGGRGSGSTTWRRRRPVRMPSRAATIPTTSRNASVSSPIRVSASHRVRSSSTPRMIS